MSGFSVYYIEALIACILLFLVLLINNHFNIDRQEKQIKLDHALIAFILYFIADCFWAALEDGLIAKTRLSVVADTFALYVFMAGMCYFWLEYVMAVEQAPNRNRPVNRFIVLLPFVLSTAALIIHYLTAPQMIIDDNLVAGSVYSIYLMATPIVYLVAILFYTLKRARGEENPAEKRRHLFIGLFPLSTLIAGIIQEALFKYIPIYCFVDSLLILTFYIQSIEARVSIDPLTDLNNRGEMMRYISQKSNLYQEGRDTVVMMTDINRFKEINDSYGHAEGDKALVIIAAVLKKVILGYSMPSFISRYGGDEFLIIIHPEIGSDTDRLIGEIREKIDKEIREKDTGFELSLSMGYDLMGRKDDSIHECIRRADVKLYKDKELVKSKL